MLNTILRLLLISIIPISVALLMKYLDKYTKLGKIVKLKKQIIAGLIFGICSILGTVFGVATESGAVINLRDASPIIAGLVFGGPSGIIAGCIGGLYRFISVYWGGSGTYTQIACSVSTVMAGIFTWLVRKIVFKEKSNKWFYGFGLGVLIEDFHMLMVFFTHMGDITQAYVTVRACAIPMILANSVAIAVALIGTTLIAKEPLTDNIKPKKLSTVIQTGLLASLLFAYCLISLFTYVSLKNSSKTSRNELLESNVMDVVKDVEGSIDSSIEGKLDYTLKYFNENYNKKDIDTILEEIKENAAFSEVSLINHNTIITNSTTKEYVGFDMSSGDQAIIFNKLLKDTDILIQSFQAITKDDSVKMKYAGVSLYGYISEYGYIQVGYDSYAYHELLNNEIKDCVANRHVGSNGHVLVCTEKGTILSSPSNFKYGFEFNFDDIVINDYGSIEYEDELTSFSYYTYSLSKEGFVIVALADQYETDLNTNISFVATTLTEIFIFLIMYCVIYVLIHKNVVGKISNVNDGLHQIGAGDLSVKINERDTYEFNNLSSDINKTVVSLRRYMDKDKEKREEELMFAKSIQASALPTNFAKLSNHDKFDLFAKNVTAKEVGGDFYDYYYVTDSKLAILIADVSGKGIPAAMFMMQAKSIIKGLAKQNLSADVIFTEANKRLCEGNSSQMFVTAWLGIIDLETGHMEYVNAGHNPPVIVKDGVVDYLKSKAGFILAGLDNFKYTKLEMDLKSNDQIFLYTDGVTEANNTNHKLYGEERLLKVISNTYLYDSEDIVNKVEEDVKEFTEGEEQSDDITMLSFKYIDTASSKTIEVEAKRENVNIVLDESEKFLTKYNADEKTISDFNIMIDEIFANIASYAYENGEGKCFVKLDIIDDSIRMEFRDNGKEYNPLAKEDPDITKDAKSRAIGGLGIYMVKKMSDSCSYKYSNNQNVLTIIKKLRG